MNIQILITFIINLLFMIAIGGLTVLVWRQLYGGFFELYEIVPGFILSLAAIFLFSFTGKQSEPNKPQ